MMQNSFLAKCPQGWMAVLMSVAALFPGTALADASTSLALANSDRGNVAPCSGPSVGPALGALERMRMSQQSDGVSGPSCDAGDESDAVQARRFLGAFGGARPAPRAGGGMDSVAVPVSRTAFDARWQRVRAGALAGGVQASLSDAGVTRGIGGEQMLTRVNRWVNQNIAYQSDDRLYGQKDYWATASETLAKKSGDCEDFAILKMHMLRAAGMEPSKMRLMLLRDLAANADHAFLVVSTDGGDMILDNLTDRVYRADEARAVRPILSFSEDRRWVHALRSDAAVQTVQVALASAGQ
jgi:predicted transglutaminase-like cysteine proteinase